jgi:phosphoacetylglucosamine mutase
MNIDMLRHFFNTYPKPLGFTPSYGTAGFRTKATNLDSTMFRCGVLMGIKSMISNHNCGIMITASHNEESDNGLKLINYDGEMINKEWEHYATLFAQADTFEEFMRYVHRILANNSTLQQFNNKVVVGIDTRKSGKKLAFVCADGVRSCGLEPLMTNHVTTPELHFYTVMSNMNDEVPSYCSSLVHHYKELLVEGPLMNTVLHVDCANGVGAIKLLEMKQDLLKLGLSLVLYNIGDGKLNHECGADFVEKECQFPTNMNTILEYTKCCSLDGDADRIVYFTKVNGNFKLINGDKIACLFTSYFNAHSSSKMASIGYVQTAYANGASTNYIKQSMKNVDVVCADTGVQYLHHEAKNYDIGVYFEANGHGTVLFKDAQKFQRLSNILSQYTGDAIGNMLFVEYILRSFDFKDWIMMYEDLHTKQVKIPTDKRAFSTINFGKVCVTPVGLQDSIDSIISKYRDARAFVRPSGTEDVVRLYVECSDINDIATLSADLLQAIDCHVK